MYSNAIQLFKEKKYKESKRSFLKSLRVEKLTDQQVKNCIKNVQLIDGDSFDIEMELQIASDLYGQKKYLICLSLLSNIKLNSLKSLGQYIFLYLDVLEELGEIELLKKKLIFFSYSLYKNKKLNLIEKIDQFLKNKKFLNSQSLLVSYFLSILNQTNEIFLLTNLENKDELLDLQETLENKLQIPVDKIILLKSINELNSDNLLSLFEKKKLLNFLYRSFITHAIEPIMLELLLKYSMKEHNKNLSLSICKSNIKVSDDDSLSIAKFPDNNTETTKVDFANELFNENMAFDNIKKMVRDIRFLMSQGKNVTNELSKLKAIDPENLFLMEIDSVDLLDSKYIGKSDSISLIENDLLTEISKYSGESLSIEKDLENLITSYKSYINFMDFAELLDNYSDLIVVFNQLNASVVSEKICEKVEKIIIKRDLKEKINFYYLQAETLRHSKKMFLSLNVIDKVLESYPLNENEKVCFLYMKAEIYRKLDNQTEALKYYALVKKMNNNYRLVKQRLKEID